MYAKTSCWVLEEGPRTNLNHYVTNVDLLDWASSGQSVQAVASRVASESRPPGVSLPDEGLGVAVVVGLQRREPQQ